MAKRKTKKQAKGKPLKQGFPRFLWPAIGLGIIIIGVVAYILTRASSDGGPIGPINSGEPRCAIVDQLYSIRPNPTFIEEMTRELNDYGLEVDVYQGDVVTVDFYRQLPRYDYDLIIFRVHSGLLRSEEEVGETVWLFTSEPYERTRYFFEQLGNQVTSAKTSEDAPSVFAISAKFISNGMEEEFTDTAIILMGCAAFQSEDVAQAFIDKGASTYLAWDASVLLSYVDDTTAALVRKLCSQELTIREAVSQTMEEKGPDPSGNAILRYYPLSSADKTLRQLIK